MGSYRLLIKSSAAKEIEAVAQKKDRQRIVSRIRSLAENPRPSGSEKLSGLRDRYRIRVGDFRVIYSIEDKVQEVLIVRVAHRKEVYR